MITLTTAIDIQPTITALQRMDAGAEGVMRQEVGAFGGDYRATLVRETPRGKGENSPNLVKRYETSAHYSRATAEYRITNEAPQLRWVLNGRGPIHVKNGRALRFVIGGVVFYRVSVRAAKANPFDKRTRREMEPKITALGGRIRTGIVARFKQ